MTPGSVSTPYICESNVDNSVTIARRLLVLYGSQTGVARSLAERIVSQISRLFGLNQTDRYPLEAELYSLDEYRPVSRLSEERGLVLIVCSTTGYGVPPENMVQFWRRIMHKSLPIRKALPSSVKILVIGIGDSSYPRYNVVAKKLYRRLLQLGAIPFTCGSFIGVDPGLVLADELSQLGIYTVLSSVLPELYNSLSRNWGLSFVPAFPRAVDWTTLEHPSLVHDSWPKFKITSDKFTLPANDFSSDNFEKLIQADNLKLFPTDMQYYVIKNERVTALDHFQDTRLISLSRTKLPQDYSHVTIGPFLPGSVFYVQPRNSMDHIRTFLSVTNICPECQVTLEQLSPNFPLPSILNYCAAECPTVSVAWLVSYYFDLNFTPGPYFFICLAALADRSLRKELKNFEGNENLLDISRLQLERERLLELGQITTVDQIDDLHDYVTRPHRRVIEVLVDFPETAKLLVQPDVWFDVIPGPIRPRPYSIASAPTEVCTSLDLLIALVTYRTSMSTIRQGLASAFLACSDVGSNIIGWIPPSQVSYGFNFSPLLKPMSSVPCLCVAPGTGVAPFRSLLWYQLSLSSHPVNNVLVFGCRYSDKDFYFASEWIQLEQLQRMKLITAFSREAQSENLVVNGRHVSKRKGRVYVQHKIIERSDIVWPVLSHPQGHVLIVGNAKTMPDDVRESLVSTCETEGGMSSEMAELHISRMETEGRVQVEAWA